jgi:GNAT superfamily N-acetyltransferase
MGSAIACEERDAPNGAHAGSFVVTALRIAPLDASNASMWIELFASAGSACFCRYWQFEGTKNEWLDRCANFPEQNIAEQLDLVLKQDDRARGLVAITSLNESDRIIGWIKLTPRASNPKLRRLPVYRSRDLGDDDGVYSIGCFFVEPEARHQGVARALLRAASDHVRAWGGAALEAYPRRSSEALHDEEAWLGPEALFLEDGFAPVGDAADFAPYPVLRKSLAIISP